jgi:hypothetical protein
MQSKHPIVVDLIARHLGLLEQAEVFQDAQSDLVDDTSTATIQVD